MNKILSLTLSALLLAPLAALPAAETNVASSGVDGHLGMEGLDLVLNARRRVETSPGSGLFHITADTVHWKPQQTAVVICDMWDQHRCKSATARIAEMAPRMNELVAALRQRGVLIIHCPSDTMRFYTNYPGRKLSLSAPKVETKILQHWCPLDLKREAPLPIDSSDGGCDDDPPCVSRSACHHEIDTLEIKDGDGIADDNEAYYLMRQRGIANVFVMGVHENLAVLGRTFGIRPLVSLGQNVVLVRDLTDTMYNPRRKPFVDHFTGTDLVTEHIEKYWCPTITSDQLIGGHPFRFAADTRSPHY